MRVGPYHIVGPHEDEREPDILVLDTNVAIDIERFYFGRSGVDCEALLMLLERFPNTGRSAVNFQHGWAVAEATYRRGKGTDDIRYRSMEYACSTVLSWSPDRVKKAFESRRPPADGDRRWRRGVPFPDDTGDPRAFLVGPYGAILKLMDIESKRSQWRSKGPRFALEEYVGWMTEVLGVRQVYPLTLAAAVLVGTGVSNESARRVMKLGAGSGPDDMAARAWNAAWDVFITSLSEGLTYGLAPVPAGKLHKVLTRNIDPVNLRRDVETRVIIDTGSHRIPISEGNFDGSKKVDQGDVKRIMSLDPSQMISRESRDPDKMIAQMVAAVDDLERDMGVSNRIAFDGWPSRD